MKLVENERIVQAWRVGNWDAGVFSMIRFELAADGAKKTKLTFIHDAIPAGQAEHLADGGTSVTGRRCRNTSRNERCASMKRVDTRTELMFR